VSLLLGDERGFTVFEMAVVMAILGTVLASLSTVFVSGTRAQLNNNNRFQAQQSARLGIEALRLDAHNACAVNVATGGGAIVFASVPLGDPTKCGAVAASASYPKITWCALQSPSLSTAYALYRSTVNNSTAASIQCTAANGVLKADRLTTNTGLFGLTACASSTICPGQFTTLSVSLPVSFKTGTFGAPYTLSETLALRNAVYRMSTSVTACSATDSTVCNPGTCSGMGSACYPPVIQ
jgi:prepilin-type N-terminal cleavage/methylation domain-containing protein